MLKNYGKCNRLSLPKKKKRAEADASAMTMYKFLGVVRHVNVSPRRIFSISLLGGQGRDCARGVAGCRHSVTLNCAPLLTLIFSTFSSPKCKHMCCLTIALPFGQSIRIKMTNRPWWRVPRELMPSLSGVKWAMYLGKGNISQFLGRSDDSSPQ